MSTAEQTISEGYATDRPVFQPPERSRDAEKPRYVTFLGSLIDPEVATSRPWTKGGGIEIANPCLRVVKNFIRRGRITPVLYDHHDFMSYDVARKYVGGDPFGAGYHPQPIPQGYHPPALPPSAGEFQAGFGQIAVGGPTPYGSLVFRWAFPGDQIQAILLGPEAVTNTNIRRGVVEHTSLAGHDYRPEQIGDVYADRTIWEIQKAIFPDYPILPPLLDDIERLLDAAKIHTSIRPIIDDNRVSLNLFRDYANISVNNIHAEMRKTQGKYEYVSQDFVLLAQLGMERQDRAIRQTARELPANSQLESMFQQFIALQIEEKQLNLERLKRVSEPVIDEHTMQVSGSLEGQDGYPGQSGYSGYSGEVVAETAPEVKMFTCEHCGQEMKATGKGIHLSRWCSVLHSKE